MWAGMLSLDGMTKLKFAACIRTFQVVFSPGAIAAVSIIFFVGEVADTVVFNVPLNDKLKNIASIEKHAL